MQHILIFILVLQPLRRKKALDGGSLKPPYRRKLDVDKEGKLKIFRSLLEKKHITLDVYISNIIES